MIEQQNQQNQQNQPQKECTISAKMCEVVSDLEHLPESKILEVLKNQYSIDKWVYILHDKDLKEDGTPKNPHWHIYLHFDNARQFKYIAKWFGIPVSFVSKIKGRFCDAVSYAIHKNRPNKFQYSTDELKYKNVDISLELAQSEVKGIKDTRLFEILSDIDTGKIKEYNIYDKVSLQEYVKYKQSISTAFDFLRNKKKREVNRKMDVIYICGGSGCGKSTYARYIAQKREMDVFASSGGSDIFDGYLGQPCVILDDFRPDIMPFADLLKLLDNHYKSSVRSRYHNVNLECDLLIITCVWDLNEFYRRMQDSVGEEYKQLRRRVGTFIKMNDNEIKIYLYNENCKKYELIKQVSNDVLKSVVIDTFEERKKHSLELLGLADQPEAQYSYEFGEFYEIL